MTKMKVDLETYVREVLGMGKSKKKKKIKQKGKTKTKEKTDIKTTTKVVDFKADFNVPKIHFGNSLIEHIFVALEEYSNEVLGILIGCDTPDGTIIEDVAILPQIGTGGHVELEENAVVQYMADNINIFESGKRIVGWWHTHPNMGVHQSGTDTQNNKDLIAPFVYSKKPCFMFSVITSKKWERGGNMWSQYGFPQYTKRPLSAEDINIGLYVFFTLGGFYACETLPLYYLDDNAPYSISDINQTRYEEIFDNFETNLKNTTSTIETPKQDFTKCVNCGFLNAYCKCGQTRCTICKKWEDYCICKCSICKRLLKYCGCEEKDLTTDISEPLNDIANTGLSQREKEELEKDFRDDQQRYERIDPHGLVDEDLVPETPTLEDSDLPRYKCDITRSCDTYDPLTISETGEVLHGYCGSGDHCGIRYDEIAMESDRWELSG